MLSLSTPSSSRPLPLLPLELKRSILSFCSPATLAVTSQVSLAFLEMSSPFLYTDVVVFWERLPLLFSRRVSTWLVDVVRLGLSTCRAR
jgi:hypothetical protein